MLQNFAEYIVGCNGAVIKSPGKNDYCIDLECRNEKALRNVELDYFDPFPGDILSSRLKDLREITAYVFSANVRTNYDFPRPVYPPQPGRSFSFHINVRDYDFWMQQDIKELLEQLLLSMSRDDNYRFSFYKMQPGALGKRPVWNPHNEEYQITLFSGGLDSVAGLIELLESTNKKIILVSHQAGLPEIALRQDKLFSIISNLYPGRCSHFRFQCNIPDIDYDDKNIGTRGFLYCSSAFILSSIYNQNHLYVYENGISSLGFDQVYSSALISAGRQSHPKTLGLLAKLFSRISEKEFHIEQPFLFSTKADVISVLKKYDRLELFKQTVSCCNLMDRDPGSTHCGSCAPCIERILAVLASGIHMYDLPEFYKTYFPESFPEESGIRSALVMLLESAHLLARQDINAFYKAHRDELMQLKQFVNVGPLYKMFKEVYNLHARYIQDIESAIDAINHIYPSKFTFRRKKSFYDLLLNLDTYREEAAEYSVYTNKKKSKIPSRGLKKLLIDTCTKLIQNGTITECIKESREQQNISRILIAELEKDYIFSSGNKASASDYFRKEELKLSKKGGELKVIDAYPAKTKKNVQ